MSAETLESALRELGIRCRVEGLDRLALVVPHDDEAGRDAVRVRREALRLIGAHGFTNLALDLPGESADRAPVHRD